MVRGNGCTFQRIWGQYPWRAPNRVESTEGNIPLPSSLPPPSSSCCLPLLTSTPHTIHFTARTELGDSLSWLCERHDDTACHLCLLAGLARSVALGGHFETEEQCRPGRVARPGLPTPHHWLETSQSLQWEHHHITPVTVDTSLPYKSSLSVPP